MITTSPEDFGYVQVERPIKDGKAFLSQVREVGRMVLGGEYVSSLSEISLEDDGYGRTPQLVNREVPTYEPLMEVCADKDFFLILLHRGWPKQIASRYNSGYIQNRLAADHIQTHRTVESEDGSFHRAKVRLPSLTVELNGLAAERQIDANNSPIVCDRIDRVGEPGDDIILGLSPKVESIAARIVYEQAEYSFDRLEEISARSAYPISPWQVTAPFARVPGDISDQDYIHLIGGLQDLLPQRLCLGGVDYRSKDRPRT